MAMSAEIRASHLIHGEKRKGALLMKYGPEVMEFKGDLPQELTFQVQMSFLPPELEAQFGYQITLPTDEEALFQPELAEKVSNLRTDVGSKVMVTFHDVHNGSKSVVVESPGDSMEAIYQKALVERTKFNNKAVTIRVCSDVTHDLIESGVINPNEAFQPAKYEYKYEREVSVD